MKQGRLVFPDPYDETALHPCVKNIPVLFQCPHGFLYNHIDNVCDRPGLKS
nr:chitin-binding domain-containing protein [Nocardiopsis mwathae]